MGLLRQLSTFTQVIVATHSPLVLNELHGDEISIITRDERGTHAVTLSDTPHYRERAAAYRNGEIWLACADGKQERVLVTGASA
jgi:predicted ATPase